MREEGNWGIIGAGVCPILFYILFTSNLLNKGRTGCLAVLKADFLQDNLGDHSGPYCSALYTGGLAETSLMLLGERVCWAYAH